LLSFKVPQASTGEASTRWHDDVVTPESLEACNVTAVTAFYPAKSKYPAAHYFVWLRQLVNLTRVPLVIFCDPGCVSEIQQFAANRKSVEVRGKARTNFAAQRLDLDWDAQFLMDHEHFHHSAELYRIWFEKSHFVLDAIATNSFNTGNFAWIDAGWVRNSFTQDTWSLWPDHSAINQLADGRMHLLQLQPYTLTERVRGSMGLLSQFQGKIRLGAGHIFGRCEAWPRWVKQYEEVLLRMHRAGMFVGKEQDVMANLALLFPNAVCRWPARRFPDVDFEPWRDLITQFSTHPLSGSPSRGQRAHTFTSKIWEAKIGEISRVRRGLARRIRT
jgi:hypothetical protein